MQLQSNENKKKDDADRFYFGRAGNISKSEPLSKWMSWAALTTIKRDNDDVDLN